MPNQFLARCKNFGPAQNVLGSLDGRGIGVQIQTLFYCLVLLQVPKCFAPVQIFCARPNIYLHIVAVTKILCQTKRWFSFSKIGFCAVPKVFEVALNAVKFLGWLKKLWLVQNILRPVKGQGIYLSAFVINVNSKNWAQMRKNLKLKSFEFLEVSIHTITC